MRVPSRWQVRSPWRATNFLLQLFVGRVGLQAAAGVLQTTRYIICSLLDDGVGFGCRHCNRFVTLIGRFQLRFISRTAWRQRFAYSGSLLWRGRLGLGSGFGDRFGNRFNKGFGLSHHPV